ncbi:MAG TPA: M1 family metallopeptidase [Gemmatimonadaceae bacterium]|nr:M1 family metallopeptidase [Gemmatimonadaceae bacterium]
MRMLRGSILALAILAGGATSRAQISPAAPPPGRDTTPHPYRPGIDVLHYDLSLDLPIRGNLIRARAVLTLLRTAPVDTLVLDLRRMEVESVLVNGMRVPFTRTPDELHLPLAAVGRTFQVAVAYGGAVEDGLIVRVDSAGRWTGFGDNWPNRARNWIPSVDHPSDKATVSWRVHAPTGRTVVANGALVERRDLGDGFTITRWQESRAVPVYVMVIAAAPLVEYALGQTACGLASTGRCVPQMVYVAPEQRPELPGAFAQAGAIVRWFSELVGPFPYEKLAHLQSSTRFGGMENASAIFYADGLFRRAHGMTEGLIAHETAHQWFGDAVTEREWPHVWLSEGFATYFAALWTRHAHGDSAFRADMARIRQTVLADSASVPVRPVIDTVEGNLLALLNRNSYEKGAFVLQMLRVQVGERAFFQALRRYYADHRGGTVLSDDLRLAMERASGQRLGWFFDQWLRRPGYPELDVTWRYDPSSQQVALDVTQQARFGAYRFPLTVAVRDSLGHTTRATIEIPARAASHLVLPLRVPVLPASVAVDPDVELLARIQVHPNGSG